MDQIQKILIKADRKDLAQEYYEKLAKEELSAWNQGLKDSKPIVERLQKSLDYIKRLQTIKEPTTKVIGTLRKMEDDIKKLRKTIG